MILLPKDFKIPEDGYYQIAPFDSIPGVMDDQPVMQIVDDAAVAAMISHFKAESANPNFPGLLWDYDHFSMDIDKPSKAAGWIDDLQSRADGLYAHVRWTPSGEQAVTSGEYRGCSPVWDMEPTDSPGRMRPTHLLSVALTNDPNIKTMKPLSNRSTKEGATPMGDSPAGGAPAAPVNPQAQASIDPATLAALGLKPGASAVEIAQAVQALTAQVQQLNAATADAQADKDLQDYSDVIGNKDQQAEIKKQLIANRAGTIVVLNSIRAGRKTVIVNRGSNMLPDAAEDVEHDARTAAEVVRGAKIRNRANDIMKTQKVGFAVAWNRAAAEFPAEPKGQGK